MELRPDVSLVVVVDDNEKLLVIKRSKQSTDAGRWESPVGHRDSGETAEEAALREVKEETGLKVTLFPESFQKTNPDGKKIQVFMARAKTTEVKLEPKEHDEFKWLTLKEIEDLTPTHPSYKKDVAKIIKLNADKQKEKKAMLGRGYIPPQLRNNNYVATYPLGANMPKKPNPAAQVKPVQAVKADAAGIQKAMAKRAWEVDDETGLYSNKPLMYAYHLTAPPRVSRNSPDWENEFVDKTLQQASKKLPDNRQLHWIDFDAITGNRPWYNPMRYLAGKDIIGEKNYALGRDSDDTARSEIVKQILMNNNLLSHYPAKYLDEDMSKEKNMSKRGAVKVARNLNLGDIPSGSGPQQMANALNMFNQAKALANVEGTRKQHGLSQTGLNRVLSQLEGAEGEDYDFDQYRSNPKANAAWSGIAGAGLGGLAGYMGAGIPGALGGAALGGAGGAGYGYLNASSKNQELMRTAKLLRDYGLLTPDHLRQAMPLLKASEDKKPKMKDKDFSTGADALDSLKEHMRKKGCDEFQVSFFSRLLLGGMNANQIKVAIDRVEALDKQAAESLKSGFEKLGFAQALKGLTKNIPGQIRNWWGAKPSQIMPAVKSFGQSFMKNPLQTAKPLAGRALTGAQAGLSSPMAPNIDEIGSDPMGYARKALPHALGGAAVGALGGKTTQKAFTRANTGAGVGQTLGFLGDTALGTDNLRPALSNAGFMSAGLAGRKLQPSQINMLDPMNWLAAGGKMLKNNPILTGGGLIGGGAALGGTAIGNGLADANPVSEKNKATTQQMINEAISSNQGINDTLNTVKDTANSWNANNVLGSLGGQASGAVGQLNEGAGGFLNNLGLGNLGDTIKNNPWLLPMLLTGLAGGAGGYALGGRGGAALGGIGLPLIMYLLSQQNKGNSSNVAPPLNNPPASAAAVPAIPPQNAKYSPRIKPDGLYVAPEDAPAFGGPAAGGIKEASVVVKAANNYLDQAKTWLSDKANSAATGYQNFAKNNPDALRALKYGLIGAGAGSVGGYALGGRGGAALGGLIGAGTGSAGGYALGGKSKPPLADALTNANNQLKDWDEIPQSNLKYVPTFDSTGWYEPVDWKAWYNKYMKRINQSNLRVRHWEIPAYREGAYIEAHSDRAPEYNGPKIDDPLYKDMRYPSQREWLDYLRTYKK